MSEVVYLNGGLVPREAAMVSVYDGGWLHGAGLFETMRAHRGVVFRLDAHLDRMMESAGKVLFPLERPDLPLTKDFVRLLQENGLSDARVRLTVTAGSMVESSSDASSSLTVCVTAAPQMPYPVEFYERGVAVLVSQFRQSAGDPLAGHKTTNYLARLLALREAQKVRCSEALWFTPENLLAEGSVSNVFVVKDGVVKTPPRDTPVLPGITRAVVLECVAEQGTEAREEPVNINQLLDADEVFITNSGMGIMPVVRVEQHEIGCGKPGPVTRVLMEQHRQRLEAECVVKE